MNIKQKIACLIGMMVLLNANTLAQGQGSYGGMGDVVLGIILIFIFLPIYTILRLTYLFHGIALFKNKQSMENWLGFSFLLLFLDVPILGFGFELYQDWNQSKQRRKMDAQIEKLSRITLSQPQEIASILMPKGTKLQTHVDYEKMQPELEKFTYASFPEPIVWNGIPIIDMGRNLHSNHFFWNKNHEITTESNQLIGIGQWLCKANVNLEWKMLPESPENLPFTQDIESLVYLDYCVLERGQRVSLPTFHLQAHFQLDSGSGIRRKSDTFRDVAKGLWYINMPEKDEIKSAMRMDYYDFEIMVDSKKTVHNFLIELNDSPEKHCGLPKNTLLGWRKSQPKTILVATYPTQNVPKKCWGKKLRKVSVDEMRNALPQQDGWSLNMAKQHFESQSTQP